MKYPIVQSGELVRPRMRGYKLMCCDCGLVHKMNYRVVDAKSGSLVKGVKVQFKAYRDNRATAASRRARAKRGE